MANKKAVVAFSGEVSFAPLALLKAGFCHCFVAVCDGSHWLTIDPMLHKIDVVVQPAAADFDLAAWYQSLGYVTIEAEVVNPPLKIAPIGLFSCVGVVKRILGIHKRWVLTPWQLYKFLENTKNRKIILDNEMGLG